MTYDYRFDPDAPWPVVRGVISGPKGALSIRLVLDSGAHKTQLNRGTMIALGFREQAKTREAFSVGVGGRAGARLRGHCPQVSGDTNSDPLAPVLIPTPIMPSCYRLSTPLSGSFLVFTSVSRWVCSGSTFVNLDRINPLLRFSRSR